MCFRNLLLQTFQMRILSVFYNMKCNLAGTVIQKHLPYNRMHDAKNGGFPLCDAVSAIFFLPELSKKNKRQMSETVIRIRKNGEIPFTWQ